LGLVGRGSITRSSRPVQLEFDPNVPEFRVGDHREVGSGATAASVDGRAIGTCREEVSQLGVHPLVGELSNGFLKRLALTLSAKGQLLEDRAKPAPSDAPQLYRRPLLFVRSRAVGFAKVLESIIADVESGGALPLPDANRRRGPGEADQAAESVSPRRPF
jgi:hypothetical protein